MSENEKTRKINPNLAKQMLEKREETLKKMKSGNVEIGEEELKDVPKSSIKKIDNDNKDENNLGKVDMEKPEPKISRPDPNNPEYQSLGNVDYNVSKKSNEDLDVGWKKVPVESLPSQGIFYSNNTLLQIRSATSKEIRHFSTIDDGDLIDADSKITYIIQNCTRLRMEGKHADYKDLVEIDRLYLALAIREITFSKGENKLQMNVTCEQCDHVNNVEIKKDNINYIDLEDDIMKYYDEESKSFKFTYKENDNRESFNLYLPTIGVSKWITNHVQNLYQNKKSIDEAFVNIAPFLFEDYRKINEKYYNNINQTSYSWSALKISLIVGLIDKIRKSIDFQVKSTCENCGSEVTATLEFPGGYKSLFLYADPFSYLS